ncbi:MULTISPECIES: flagellar biosynthesis anti-sigma factor FlgM [Vibrio]|uniref:flagellar biosynthesis anti-sigma factor FlgM n=2 Tax=Vibrionaceae TaxID=641 RepID=UPI00178DA188|nr:MULTISPECIES: flagellar biosynthesis anti-sigma factor FlgM [Vibrio]MCF4175812.1 flagellar biosynthesis anti-sigma factor FlgM [Vibrio sp. McD22-P3]MCY9851836.1 flagellar biosynthesis anti-sigma factor FlgM [Vibrio mediterranei]NUW71632.1 flagellar biosynthesis anti-sigma factor FlgM [Vibrio mediterranei]USE01325.1 flagellar biosynthesis anti-sigma factor FlgM [Vibrio sp. SCSIO 43133]
MSQIKVDNVKHIVPHTQVDVVQNKKVEPDQKVKVKQINLSQHEVDLLENAKSFFDGVEEIDSAKVEQIKAQIASGELVFDMDELAKVIARLDHGQ